MSGLKRKSGDALGATDANKKPRANASITSFFGSKPAAAPSSSPNSSSSADPAPSKFDKAKWVATLTPEQKRHLALEIQTLDPSWLALLKDEIVRPEFLALKKFLEAEVKSGKKVFPPREDVYSWSRHTPFHRVRAVILGQDPYHNVNQAHGLCFSVRPPTPAPPSLKNMYKALARDYPSFSPPPNHGGLLTPWAESGVLMLNTCLTVRAHEANSHANRGWERFTQRVIDLVAQKRPRGVVFLAWGAPAGKRVAGVDTQKHLVLRSAHPSPLSASRGFFDCGHFRKANEWLEQRYGKEGTIDWDLNPAGEEEKAEEEQKQQKSPTPVVAVGKVAEDGKLETSEALDKEGEDPAAVVDGAEAEDKTEE
ncbi:uracil-DNA glycosylase [Xylariomycetidae sp. FL0641]|nr:uracil-DNA glycosylase [Xylariomycetidae sp. FL0641]